VTDLAAQLRPITAEEWPRFFLAMETTFGDAPSGPYQQTPPPVAELDRSLALPDGDRFAVTAGIYSRQLSVPGGVVPTAAVTWVTVAPTHRRRGLLTAVMRRQLDEVHAAGREPVAALWAAEGSIYGRFGYAPAAQRGGWTGAAQRLRLRPEVDCGTGSVRLVDPAEFRPAAVALHDRLHRFVPGNLTRDGGWWDRELRDDPSQRDRGPARQPALHTETDGTVTGSATYRLRGRWSDRGEPEGTLTVGEVRATSPTAYAAVWRFLFSHDLVRTVEAPDASVDEPVRHLLADPRAWHAQPTDSLWVRPVDVGAALSARRYPVPLDLVLEVRDRFCDWNEGRWHLWGHPAGAFCDRTDRDPDLVLDIEALSAAYLGGVSLAALQGAGRVTEISPGAVVQASTGFGWPVAPWCPDHF
jgi:predicted acetyltransferase